MGIEVKVPDIGDFTEVPVVSVLVNVGDTVSEEDPLIELESDKATMEVPSPVSGKIVEMKVAEGDNVSEGSLILLVEAEGGAPAPKPDAGPAPAPAAEAAPASAPAQSPSGIYAPVPSCPSRGRGCAGT